MATNTESLRIQLTLDVADLDKKLRDAKKRLADLGGTTVDVAKRTNQANTALINFGRVVQDAPYVALTGQFAAIANNIDPLIESFNRLKQTSGSTGAAFRQLFAGLAGPAGIGIAISAVTSALVLFGPEIKNALFGVEKLTDEQKKAAEASKQLAESLANEILQVQLLGRIAADESRTRGERLQALRAFEKIYPNYLSGLKTEQERLNAISIAAEAATKALISKVVFQATEKQLSEQVLSELAKQLDLQQALNQEVPKAGDAQASVNKAYQNYIQLSTGYTASQLQQAAATTNVIGIADKFTKSQLGVNRILNAIRATIDSTVTDLLGFGASITDVTKAIANPKDPPDKPAKDANKAYKELRQSTVQLADDLKKQNELYSEQVNRILSLQDAVRRLREEEAKRRREAAERAFAEGETGQLRAPTDLAKGLVIPKAIQDLIDAQAKLNEKVKESAEQYALLGASIANIFEQSFNAILSGSNPLEAIGKAIKQLTVRLIAAAAAAAVLNALLPGGAASGALSQLGKAGAFIQKITQLAIGGRETGGSVRAGQPYLVGERYPEVFVPNTSGSIVNANNLAMAGGGMALTARVSGNDLLFLLNRAQRQERRLG